MDFDTIYDSIFTILENTLPDRRELINPYNIEDNNGLFLKAAYGVSIGPMIVSDTFGREIRQVQRSIAIDLTEQFHSTDKKTNARKVDEKKLVSDQLLAVVALKNNLPSDFLQFVGDDGVEYIFPEDSGDFIRLRTNFIINYNVTVR